VRAMRQLVANAAERSKKRWSPALRPDGDVPIAQKLRSTTPSAGRSSRYRARGNVSAERPARPMDRLRGVFAVLLALVCRIADAATRVRAAVTHASDHSPKIAWRSQSRPANGRPEGSALTATVGSH
jgi:hypothetical protein